MVKKIVLFIVLALLVCISNVYSETSFKTSLGVSLDAVPGAIMPTNSILYKLDLGLVNKVYSQRENKLSRFYWTQEFYFTGLFNKKDDSKNIFTGGPGYRLRTGVSLGKVNLFIGGGILTVVDSGRIDNLAGSVLLGTLEGGFEVNISANHSFAVTVDHVSSPFHDGSDGDVGVNLIMVTYKIKFDF